MLAESLISQGGKTGAGIFLRNDRFDRSDFLARDVQRGADGEGKLCGIAVPVVDSLCARDVEANVGWHLI